MTQKKYLWFFTLVASAFLPKVVHACLPTTPPSVIILWPVLLVIAISLLVTLFLVVRYYFTRSEQLRKKVISSSRTLVVIFLLSFVLILALKWQEKREYKQSEERRIACFAQCQEVRKANQKAQCQCEVDAFLNCGY